MHLHCLMVPFLDKPVFSGCLRSSCAIHSIDIIPYGFGHHPPPLSESACEDTGTGMGDEAKRHVNPP